MLDKNTFYKIAENMKEMEARDRQALAEARAKERESNVSLDTLISNLYIPLSDEGFVSRLLRNANIRRAIIETSAATFEYVSVVDVFGAAGYRSPSTNWMNIAKCYFQDPFTAMSWASVIEAANKKFIMPAVTCYGISAGEVSLRGKTAVIPFRKAVSALSRLPATRERTIADINRIYKEQEELLRHFDMQPTGCIQNK